MGVPLNNSNRGSTSPSTSYFSYNLDTKGNIFKEVHPCYDNVVLLQYNAYFSKPLIIIFKSELAITHKEPL